MNVRTPTNLKARFESNDIPQQADYGDIFDSFLPISSSGKQTLDISLEITGDFTASGDIYGKDLYVNKINAQRVSASAISFNTVDATQVSAQTVNTNQLNASVVSASTATFDRVNANYVSASGGFFNLITSQQVSASVVNTNIINAQSVSASAYRVGGVKVVGTQQAAVVQASGGATIDAEARTALNSLITHLRTHGLIAS